MSAPLVAVTSAWPAVAVGLPLIGVALAAVGGGVPERGRAIAWVALGVSSMAVAFGLAAEVLAGRAPGAGLLHMTPTLWLSFRVDAPGALYGATVAGLGALALAYSLGYVPRGVRRARYFAFLFACLACTLGVAYAADLFTFLIFYEAFSVLTYALVVHEQTPAALAAGAKYIAYVLVGGSLILAGVLQVYFLAGGLTFAAGGMLPADASAASLLPAFWCFVAGFGVKAALVPLHGWVPDAHPAAPAPFSALLSGVMVAAGAFGIARVLFDVYGVGRIVELGVAPWLGAIAAVTVLVGAVLAIGQDDLKRRLAYSTISQMGYLTLSFALLGAGVAVGALVHLVHHAFLKGALFFCAGLWNHGIGARRVSELRGVAGRMPWTSAAFSLAALGMIGIPPLAGFVSKWWLGLGMLEVGSGWALAVLLTGALLAAAYLLPVVGTVYLGAPAPFRRTPPSDPPGSPTVAPSPPPPVREAPPTMLVPAVVAATLTLVFGFASHLQGFPLQLAERAVARWFGGT